MNGDNFMKLTSITFKKIESFIVVFLCLILNHLKFEGECLYIVVICV